MKPFIHFASNSLIFLSITLSIFSKHVSALTPQWFPLYFIWKTLGSGTYKRNINLLLSVFAIAHSIYMATEDFGHVFLSDTTGTLHAFCFEALWHHSVCIYVRFLNSVITSPLCLCIQGICKKRNVYSLSSFLLPRQFLSNPLLTTIPPLFQFFLWCFFFKFTTISVRIFVLFCFLSLLFFLFRLQVLPLWSFGLISVIMQKKKKRNNEPFYFFPGTDAWNNSKNTS